MIERLIFTAQLRPGRKNDLCRAAAQSAARLPQTMGTMSLFVWQKRLFLYCETENAGLSADDAFHFADDCLEFWPGEEQPRRWVRMPEIFHYNCPVSAAQWKRPQPMQPWAQIARLRPETLSRYVYYHYQYQEERPGDGNKYGIMALHENLAFFYLEAPTIRETAPRPGALATSLRPENWGEVMAPHFIPWEDERPGMYWKKIERLYTREAE